MKDPLWNQIFKALWAEEFDRIAAIKNIRDVMLALENNPILAAYGECKTLESRGEATGQADPKAQKVLPQEWDVWLDPKDPGDLSKVKIAHGNFWTTVMQSATKGQQDKVVGYGRDDVKHSKNGGQWLELFGKAVTMYRGGAAPDGAAADGDRAAKMQAAASATTAEAAVAIAIDFLRKDNGGGLVLDVKSTYSTPGDIKIFVDMLQAKGVNVIGVGTFRHDQLDGLEAGVRAVKFYHGITGVENAAKDRSLKTGDHLMFNAGSLLSKSGGWVREEKYSIDEGAFQSLSTIVTDLELNVGLYVQEGDVDEKAVDVIVKMVNKFPHLFKDGFAYGNLSGKAETETSGTGMGSQQQAETHGQEQAGRWRRQGPRRQGGRGWQGPVGQAPVVVSRPHGHSRR
ncbi:MAG: hypothetical protein IPL61_21425 [Myxococcales bacterium]|nr:hypothetical protein [Myxococcales bacterium]